jgi:hypothetical protein
MNQLQQARLLFRLCTPTKAAQKRMRRLADEMSVKISDPKLRKGVSQHFYTLMLGGYLAGIFRASEQFARLIPANVKPKARKRPPEAKEK